MRKIIGILVCLWVAARLFAVDYQPFAYSAPATEFRSTSAYTASTNALPATTARVGTTSSFSTISSSNFSTLNSEGGLCYTPASGPLRVKTPKPDVPPIGEDLEEFPIGDTPWIFIAILIIVYFFRAKMCTGLNRGLVLVKSWLRPDQTKRPKS